MFSEFYKPGLRSKNGSTLQPEQMLEEAMDRINQTFAHLNEKNALDRLAGLKTRRELPSFDFPGSDGHILRVKVLSPGQLESSESVGNSGPQTFTILDRVNHISGYPHVRTNEGDLVFVFDPTTTSAEEICKGHGNSEGPKPLTQGVNRITKKHVAEHVPRPMNAFIIYRNTEMKAVREKYPGIGNNDVSRIIGQRWRELDPKIRAHYKELAAKSAREHQVKHPGYKYTPRKPEDVVRRRKRGTVGEHIRNPSIHRSDFTPYRAAVSCRAVPELVDLDGLTNIWVQEPTAQNFDALMEGFDHALGVATDSSGFFENTKYEGATTDNTHFFENAKHEGTTTDNTKYGEASTENTNLIENLQYEITLVDYTKDDGTEDRDSWGRRY
uniref:MAT1-2-1 protein n=1 Tax=Morchella rufobrunnea TaxID=368404 RepID=A0A7T7FRM6_9PEZI|nr:MAT1-2-1 protein [Morchella rufobrunnea]